MYIAHAWRCRGRKTFELRSVQHAETRQEIRLVMPTLPRRPPPRRRKCRIYFPAPSPVAAGSGLGEAAADVRRLRRRSLRTSRLQLRRSSRYHPRPPTERRPQHNTPTIWPVYYIHHTQTRAPHTHPIFKLLLYPPPAPIRLNGQSRNPRTGGGHGDAFAVRGAEK